MKRSYVSGLVAMVTLGLSFEACSSTNVGFSPPGDDARAGEGGAGAAHAGAGGSSNGGALGHAGVGGTGKPVADAGEAGTAEGGASGEVGAGGEAGEKSVAGSGGAGLGGTGGGGAANAGSGGGGAPNGGSAGAGAPNGGSAGGGAGGAPNGNGGSAGGGAANAGSGGGGAPNAGGSAGGAGSGGTGGSVNSVCGNQLLELAEQCDDGNTKRLDGCDSSCAFEQSQRANWFRMQFVSDAFCVTNSFGTAFPNLTHMTLQQNTDARVADGSFSLLFAFLGLADPTAPNGSASFSIGVMNGTPAAGSGYNGASDLDWWYTPAATTIDANKNPLSKLTAQISSGAVQASGVRLQLPLFSAVPLSVSNVLLRLPIGASSKPLSSTGGAPGHLAAEHLSTSLVSFESGGTQTDAGAGELCGDLSAASLRSEPIPSTFLAGGATPCTQGYTAGNSLLDLLVGGCSVSFGPVTVSAVVATQPDQVDPSTTNPGAGGPYKLSAASTHAVSACTDKSSQAVSLDTCLAAAAYSSAFKLATDRVIIK